MTIHQGRLAATARYLADEGLDALIAFNGGHNSFLESHAVFVLSGVRPIGESAVVVNRSGASTLLVTPAWERERAAAFSRTDKTVGTDDLAAALEAAVAKHAIDPRKSVTVALSTLGVGVVERIEAMLGGTVRANDKYARELARLRSRLARRRPGRGASPPAAPRTCPVKAAAPRRSRWCGRSARTGHGSRA